MPDIPPTSASDGQQDRITGSAATVEPRDDRCPHRCGYRDPRPACVRLHLIQHHNYEYDEAQRACPDE